VTDVSCMGHRQRRWIGSESGGRMPAVHTTAGAVHAVCIRTVIKGQSEVGKQTEGRFNVFAFLGLFHLETVLAGKPLTAGISQCHSCTCISL